MKLSLLLLSLFFSINLFAVSVQEVTSQGLETGCIGLPAVLVSALWWVISNRVPQQWSDLPDPAASFIRQTWKEQGYLQADAIRIKEIPQNSFYAKVILYTQELPYALAVGAPFREKIERLLFQKELLQNRYQQAEELACQIGLLWELDEVEQELQECRFVCGHERVHKEEWHTFKMLLIQLIAPFVLDAFLKKIAQEIDERSGFSEVARILRKKTVRSVGEMVIFWLSAHWFERRADQHASQDPEVIAAAVRLFERAKNHKEKNKNRDLSVALLTWILKYTHPSTNERLSYFRTLLVKKGSLE